MWSHSDKDEYILKTELETNKSNEIAQSNKVTSNANMIIGLIKRTFKFRDASTWKNLYASFIRSHLEFAVPWNPFTKGDLEKLEKIQEKATKVPHTLKNLD